MRQKADYATLLESELEKTRKELGDLANACERKDIELRDQEEIINVLKEEDTEGRRIIAEKDRKINELEEMVRKMGLDRAERDDFVTLCHPIKMLINNERYQALLCEGRVTSPTCLAAFSKRILICAKVC
ncbi:hypothetical protein ANCDUO_00900 [Ancylostoma duodenale]|uniref:Uncharacterized protein n=1 Tax=Ancylostoma duodenale TaxID=51022 RepID=A0A0C2HAV5_9BILA|nr:hypothetical protein ANCDUO_00900 [Ancylostoma duodenale]